MTSEDETLVAEGYDAVYRAVPRAPTLWQLWLDHAVGPDYPADFSHISFTTLADLHRLAEELRLGSGDTLVDLACGMGGPSLWMVSQLPIRLVGVDASSVAVELASSRARDLELSSRTEFRVGTFATTALADGEADGALSLDALQYAPSKDAALREVARILKPGKRFVVAAFESIPDRVDGLPVLGDDPVDDYRPALERAGFDIQSYEEVPRWSERLSATYGAILESSVALEREMGAEAFGALALEVALTLERQPYRRRVTVVATRR